MEYCRSTDDDLICLVEFFDAWQEDWIIQAQCCRCNTVDMDCLDPDGFIENHYKGMCKGG